MNNFLLQPARKGFSLGQLVQNAAFIPYLHVTRRADLCPNHFFFDRQKGNWHVKTPKPLAFTTCATSFFATRARPYVQAITFHGLRVKGSKSKVQPLILRFHVSFQGEHPPAACWFMVSILWRKLRFQTQGVYWNGGGRRLLRGAYGVLR